MNSYAAELLNELLAFALPCRVSGSGGADWASPHVCCDSHPARSPRFTDSHIARSYVVSGCESVVQQYRHEFIVRQG